MPVAFGVEPSSGSRAGVPQKAGSCAGQQMKEAEVQQELSKSASFHLQFL
jgi:hypothetical protein